MNKTYPDNWILRICTSCDKLVLDGEIELKLLLRPPFLIEMCPFCGNEINKLLKSDKKE